MVGGKYEEIKVSTKERRKTFLRQAAMGLYQTAKLQRDRQVSPDLLKKCYREKKLVQDSCLPCWCLSFSQLPSLLLCNKRCGTKSGTKANINLDRAFDLAESQARLPNSQQTSPRFAEALLGWLLAQLTNRELHSTPPRVTRPALRCPSLGLCSISSTGDLQRKAGTHLVST